MYTIEFRLIVAYTCVGMIEKIKNIFLIATLVMFERLPEIIYLAYINFL